MIRISRHTDASTAPIPMRIETNRRTVELFIPGPYYSIEIPGDRIRFLEIGNAGLYGIRIVSDGDEYRLDEIDRIRDLDNVTAIIIFDGFLYGNATIGPVPPFGGPFNPIVGPNGIGVPPLGAPFIGPGYPGPYGGCGPNGVIGIVPGYTYRPTTITPNGISQSGKSFLYPPVVAPIAPLGTPLPPPPLNPYNQYGYPYR